METALFHYILFVFLFLRCLSYLSSSSRLPFFFFPSLFYYSPHYFPAYSSTVFSFTFSSYHYFSYPSSLFSFTHYFFFLCLFLFSFSFPSSLSRSVQFRKGWKQCRRRNIAGPKRRWSGQMKQFGRAELRAN